VPRKSTAEPESARSASDRAAQRVVDELQRMIINGELLPGQQVRQEVMAERLGVSRLPIREGLRQLTAEGLVRHVHNVGYTVARLEQSEFDQIYLMRAALEQEILLRLPVLDNDALVEIRALGDEVIEAADRVDILAMRLSNQAFHFAMFDRSPMNLMVHELRRLWILAMPYHLAYLYDPQGRAAVLAEHEAMIDALKAHDNQRLVELMNAHRHGGESSTSVLLSSAGVAPNA
jgi:DNA-binding GntR family transcriptional regulator